ncbi:hypothetical protein TVAG_434600 [Trichomonas vaginalis G3]|uniref:Thioredoxin domain-containing protein n=1 Tax=Trichomonas vaginalis (strain ATCC PRA-98 / G3) TaxID=412133 RepID=A2DSP3_TRIV3|nr:thioredoxin-like family [Trichomonas vaginalis G3]EAY16623.1 hypothetical protein TVAG_434600 [Trichomonas vaginalis G3]KAI5533000.1 thioredoxin-like family [Trichomonas vaginalis G3]|eukprot:XP_001328846.1 hypothetical protein [Trichomonas vaginalis G3]
MLFFAQFSLSRLTFDPAVNDSFIKIVNDANWNDVKKKMKEGVIFFHAPHQRASDTGYLRYVHVCRQYAKEKDDRFYVVNGMFADKVPREFKIPGWPSLVYFKNDKISPIVEQFHGPMSIANLDNFVHKYTWPGFVEVNVSSSMGMQDLIRMAFRDEFESISTGFIFGNNESRFGRICEQFAKTHSTDIRFLEITNPDVAHNIGVHFPSISIFRIEDHKIFNFFGEPKLEVIEKWYKSEVTSSINIKEFNQYELFDISGLTIHTVIKLVPREDRIGNSTMFDDLNSLYYIGTPNVLRYGDPTEMRPLLRLFNISEDAKRICVLSNYTKLGIYDCSEGQVFDRMPEFLETPPQIYGEIAMITETSWSDFIDHGPLIVLFTSKFNCRLCPEYEYYFQEAFYQARDAVPNNVRFTMWPIAENNKVSFMNRINCDAPSVVFFPSHHLTESVKYDGTRDVNSLRKWINKVVVENEEKNVRSSQEL